MHVIETSTHGFITNLKKKSLFYNENSKWPERKVHCTGIRPCGTERDNT